MAAPKGHQRYGGRQKGTPNKLTKDAREAWEAAILHAQGTAGMSMADWAVRDAESNQRFWIATLSAMPKSVELSVSVAHLHLDALRGRAASPMLTQEIAPHTLPNISSTSEVLDEVD